MTVAGKERERKKGRKVASNRLGQIKKTRTTKSLLTLTVVSLVWYPHVATVAKVV